MAGNANKHLSWERHQAELWDRVFQVTQDVVTLVEGLDDSVGLGYVRHELVKATMGVGAHLVRANASTQASSFDRNVGEARMKAIEADYWLRLIYVLQPDDKVHKDLSGVISQFSAIIRLLKEFRKHIDAESDAVSRHAHGPKVSL